MFDEEAEDKIEELVDEMFAGLVDDRDLRFWEGGIVRTAPTGAPPEYITVEIEGIYDQSVMWRGVPASLAVGDEVMVWENPITHRREMLGGSGATTTSTSSPWQKITVAVSGGDFALLSAAIAWINALPGGVAPSATRLFAINLLGGTFVEAADVTVPAWIGVDGEGETSVVDMGDFRLIFGADSSGSHFVVTGTADDSGILVDIAGSRVVLNHVKSVLKDDGCAVYFTTGVSDVELYHVVCEAGSGPSRGFWAYGGSALLWDCKADDHSNFAIALDLDDTAAGGTITTKFCEFVGTADVVVDATYTWEHLCCNVDAQRVTLTGTSTPLPITPVNLDGWPDALILDANGDTTISAPTDDEIDIEVGGVDVGEWLATGLHLAANIDFYPDGAIVASQALNDRTEDISGDKSVASYGYNPKQVIVPDVTWALGNLTTGSDDFFLSNLNGDGGNDMWDWVAGCTGRAAPNGFRISPVGWLLLDSDINGGANPNHAVVECDYTTHTASQQYYCRFLPASMRVADHRIGYVLMQSDWKKGVAWWHIYDVATQTVQIVLATYSDANAWLSHVNAKTSNVAWITGWTVRWTGTAIPIDQMRPQVVVLRPEHAGSLYAYVRDVFSLTSVQVYTSATADFTPDSVFLFVEGNLTQYKGGSWDWVTQGI